jgi:hypothetical protein
LVNSSMCTNPSIIKQVAYIKSSLKVINSAKLIG